MRVAPIFAIMALTAISSTSVTAADDPIVLAPTSPWHLTYDKESCRLSRRFGEGEQAVDAHFVKYSYGAALEILLEGKPLKPRGRVFTARFSPGDAQDHGKDALFGEGAAGLAGNSLPA